MVGGGKTKEWPSLVLYIGMCMNVLNKTMNKHKSGETWPEFEPVTPEYGCYPYYCTDILGMK